MVSSTVFKKSRCLKNSHISTATDKIDLESEMLDLETRELEQKKRKKKLNKEVTKKDPAHDKLIRGECSALFLRLSSQFIFSLQNFH